MDKTQSNILILVSLILALTCAVAENSGATIRHWESFTSFDEVTDMTLYNGEVWTATTGGLVRLDPRTMAFETYTNVDGLEMNRLFCLYVDDQNRLWVGGEGRLVDFSDPENPDLYLFTDRDGLLVEIYDIDGAPGGDSLWLANRAGVTIFLAPENRGSGLILDTYGRLGEIERDTPARRIFLDSDSIWVGTENGIAVGSRFDIRQLKAPTGWISYIPSQIDSGLDDYIRGLVELRDTVYIGISTGVYRFDRTSGAALYNINLYGYPYVYNMSLIGDSILINSVRGSAFFYDGSFAYQPTDGFPSDKNNTTGIVDEDGGFWAGHLYDGIYRRQESEMIPIDVGGTPANECREMIAAQGKFWGAFGNRELAYYENDRWTVVPGLSGMLIAMEVGPLGELWVGTFGNGVYRIMGDSVAHFGFENSALSGLSNAISYVVVPDIYSSGDAVWFADYKGRLGELVAVNPYNTEQWQNYLFIGGSNADLIVTVTGGQGVIYAGSEQLGIYAVANSGTPFFPADDDRWTFTTANSGIGSDFVNELAVDGYDTLWVGTSFGLSYQSLGEIYFNNITLPLEFGPEVTSIAFDAQGSLYAGSGRGLAVRDISDGSVECLKTTNSGLVDDKIQHLYYDKETDVLWISTSGGISRLTMEYKLATRNLDNILAYPNPYVIRYGNETVRFNYSGLAQIRIYTLSGEQVREIPVNGEWDGRNASGEAVASGLYLFTLTASDNEVGRGKIMLIRE